MESVFPVAATIAAAFLSGCAQSVVYGDEASEARLKRLQPDSSQASLYICRVNDSAPHVRSKVFVNDRPVSSLTPKTFTQVSLPAGKHSVHLYNEASFGRNMTSGSLSVDAKAGVITYVWVGVTGGGWGTLTVDRFETERDALACIAAARYAVLP